MLKFLVACLLVVSVAARPQDVDSNRVVVLPKDDDVNLDIGFSKVKLEQAPALYTSIDATTYGYAVDLSVPTTASQLTCLKTSRYNAVFIRAFSPVGSGAFDVNSVATIRNAYQAGLGIEVYMTPQPASTLQGYQQLDLLYKGLTGNGITVRSVWIQVTSPANWPGTTTTRINFINSIVARAKSYGLTVGIYTNQYDWSQITGNWNTIGSDILLWYWHVLGGGVSGETPATFDDFRSFGPWRAASVKQYAQTEVVCQLTVNRDVYAVGIPAAASKSSDFFTTENDKVVVGSIGL